MGQTTQNHGGYKTIQKGKNKSTHPQILIPTHLQVAQAEFHPNPQQHFEVRHFPVPPAAALQQCSRRPGRHPLRSRDSRDAPNGKQRRPKGCRAQAALTPSPESWQEWRYGTDGAWYTIEKQVDWRTWWWTSTTRVSCTVFSIFKRTQVYGTAVEIRDDMGSRFSWTMAGSWHLGHGNVMQRRAPIMAKPCHRTFWFSGCHRFPHLFSRLPSGVINDH